MSTVKVVRGDTWRRALVFKSDGVAPVIDLTGVQARLHVRDKTGALVVEASTANGRIQVSAEQSTVYIDVPKEAMLLAPGRYTFDLEVTFADGVRRTYDMSTLVVLKDATHD